MQVQRFRKESVRAALADVRAALGPDALVISTSSVPARGWRRLVGRREVEVAAAAPVIAVSESRPELPAPRPAAKSFARPERVEGGTPGARTGVKERTGIDLVARLCAAGVERGLAADVVQSMPVRGRRQPSEKALMEALAGELASMTSPDESLDGIEVFVGPPGAGKTTTIAKLAARARAFSGRAPMLVGADAYRVGAVEQLRLYAEILGAPFIVARTAAHLERAIAQGRTPMLVDTAGRSAADPNIRELFDLLGGRSGVRTHLVLPASTSPRDAERVLQRYAAARPTRAVLTKVDEAETPGPLVSALRGSGLKVSWLGCGQRVPEDLRRADGRLLAAMAAGEPGFVLQSTGRAGEWRAASV